MKKRKLCIRWMDGCSVGGVALLHAGHKTGLMCITVSSLMSQSLIFVFVHPKSARCWTYCNFCYRHFLGYTCGLCEFNHITTETLPRSWTERLLCSVNEKGDKLEYKKGGEPYLRKRFSERYAARKSKMVSTVEGTTTNSIKSLTARMP
jgi:hypothetical protein